MRTLFLILALGIFSFSSSDSVLAEQPVVITNSGGIEVGDKAPEFNLKNIDGKMYSFDNIMDANGNKPKGYIVVFTCNTCPYAVANEERLIELHKKYAPKGYPVVAIQPNDPAVQPGDSFQAMKENAKEKGFPFLYLIDEGQEIFPKYGATRTPEVYLVDANRVLRYHGAIDDSPRDPGSVDEKFVEKAIQSMEKGGQPEPASTKAVGCSIKTA
ncbi:thioredoxin family protein [Gramella sp. GC03-9]|uniref:Thioredoxin family protein n=1 Tax=Christiangramia oceanisediminis TaxID=2920386 RepID=A0A9X2IAK2_9FLAO|nr:thioredoxin family protein [Gramella oceanisediminis]MCP9199973.1 thioredoxin family protein [Gramella oceanisediminis]